MGIITTLIVEDDPMVAEINRKYVEDVEGFKVVGIAESTRQALEMIAQEAPDLIILDVFLPDSEGIDALQEIRRLNLPVDVIMVTAARDVETIQQVLRYGAVDYIVKPFKYERIKSALESYRLLRARLAEKLPLNQEEIDHLTGGVTRKAAALPKGLNEATLKQIALYLFKQKQAVSAEEVAEGVGVSRVTARRYLDYLEKSGKVKLEVQYGSVGRPVNRYSLS